MKSLVSSLLCLFAVTAFGQQKLGVIVGVNYAMFTNGFAKQITGQDNFGLHIGAVYEARLNNTISFNPRLLYSQQGDRTPDTQPGFGTGEMSMKHLDYELDYINVPLNFKFWNKIYLVAGPQISFLVSKKLKGAYAGDVQDKTEFGLNLGTGFTINNLFFELSAYQGLGTVVQYPNSFNGNIVNVRNAVLRLSAGYKFDLKQNKAVRNGRYF